MARYLVSSAGFHVSGAITFAVLLAAYAALPWLNWPAVFMGAGFYHVACLIVIYVVEYRRDRRQP